MNKISSYEINENTYSQYSTIHVRSISYIEKT